MGDGMPYHLEKGPVQRILENYLNTANAETMQNRINLLDKGPGPLDWLDDEAFLDLAKEEVDALAKGKPYTREGFIKHLAEHWFGATRVNKKWQPQVSTSPPNETGYWHAYNGDVAEIVRQGFRWAMELAKAQTPLAKIEILWKCPCPWFEMWVLRRPADLGTASQAVITVVMVTPAQYGAVVARSPIAQRAKAQERPDDPKDHPVPSWQNDYEWLKEPVAPGQTLPYKPRVPDARQRQHAMWVVTHKNHSLVNPTGSTINPTTGVPMFEMEIPQGAIYQGKDAVVVVSPSQPAGGVTNDGKVA